MRTCHVARPVRDLPRVPARRRALRLTAAGNSNMTHAACSLAMRELRETGTELNALQACERFWQTVATVHTHLHTYTRHQTTVTRIHTHTYTHTYTHVHVQVRTRAHFHTRMRKVPSQTALLFEWHW